MQPSYPQMVRANAEAGNVAMRTAAGPVTYAELLRRAASCSAWLDEIGAERGRPLPALLNTSADALALVLAGAFSGRPVAPLGVRLTDEELLACTRAIEGTLLLAELPFEPLGAAVAKRGDLRFACLPDRAHDPGGELDTEPDARSLVAYLYTSGTTGLPKPVPIRSDRMALRARANAELVGFTEKSIYATASPIHHVAGLGMILVALGAGAAVLPFPPFSIEAWRGLADTGVSHALLVPTMVERLLRAGCLRIDSLEVLQYGAAPMDAGVLREAMRVLQGVRFVQIFGQTEGSPISCLTHEDHGRAIEEPHLLATVGRAAPGVELRIEGADGEGVGEVCARAPHLFAPDEDGWLRTGDLGRIDAEGYLTLVGRRGDKIVRGGENVHPLEVERVLETHPGVREAAVVGIPDPEVGERICAYLVLDETVNPPTAAELRRFCRRTLSGFKVPEQWVAVEALPRNASGKVLRQGLAAMNPGRRFREGDDE
jgi:acyl-CoA synthetase (AMP-forming)/AMP-acid ligase II